MKRGLHVAALFLLGMGNWAGACPNIVPEPLADRLRDAPLVFLARIDSVAFHVVPGEVEGGTVLAFDLEDGLKARTLWWDGVASSVIALRGKPSKSFRLRFAGINCNGTQFLAGNWYLFAVADFRREIVVNTIDALAIRRMRELDGASEARAVDDAAALVRKALDPAQSELRQYLERVSDSVWGYPDVSDK